MIRSTLAPIFLCLIGLIGPAAARAQEPPDVFAFSPMNIEFMSGPIALESEPVVGAPYSAEAVTDVVQPLPDGNRIVRKSKAEISRDGQGRTRREQGLAMFGPVVNGPGGDAPQTVQISDPTTGTMVMLDLRTRTAHKLPAPPRLMLKNKIAAAKGGVHVENFEMAVPPPGEPGGVMVGRRMAFIGQGAVAGTRVDEPVVENLGTTFMEGVAVEGTRTTVTIPAGRIGNERPIVILSERWFSPDLKVRVMSRQSDPRFGETTYRLTNLTRAEPSPELFETPADFKVVEAGGNREVVIEKKIVK